MYVKTGNVVLPRVVWQVGTLEYFFGDMGLYDMRPATVFYNTVGASALYRDEHLEVLAGFGDSGFALRGLRYDAIPTVGGAARARFLDHVELGVGGEYRHEAGIAGNVNAPYQTPGVSYEDWMRGEVVDRYLEEYGEDLLDYFPAPQSRTASSWAVIGQLGFGGLGPLRWNNAFLRYERLHPERSTSEDGPDGPIEIWVHDFTDQRYALTLGDELQVRVIPDRVDIALAGLYGDQTDLDNSIAPSDYDRTFASGVGRLQLYATDTLHFLVESSVAREWSRNGNAYREHADSIFANTAGQPDARGLERGDSDERRTWQGKAGVVLNPLGPGIFVRPSLRLLYGLQYSNQNNAFGNAFVETLDQYNDFGTVERHWHQVVALEAEVWF